jgi:hypothetical protein
MSKLFLDSVDVLNGNDNLGYINYNDLKQSNKEFLRSDTWDFKFTQHPAAAYFPGNDFIRKRLMNVNLAVPTQLGMMSANLRGFQLNQVTYSGTTSGTISLDFMDMEDQAITLWLDDLRDKYGSRKNRFAFRLEDTRGEAVVTIFNSSRIPIREYVLYGMQLQDPGNGLNPPLSGDDPQNVGQISCTWVFDHFEMNPLNLPK